MYTKTNMIKTLERARKILASGFIKGRWICHTIDESCIVPYGTPGSRLRCCATGAVHLAAGVPSRVSLAGRSFAARRSARYGNALVGLINKEVKNSYSKFLSIVSVNDAESSSLESVDKFFVRTINSLKTQEQ